MFNKLSVRISILSSLAVFFIIAGGSYFVIDQQSKSLEQQLLKRGRIESVIGAKQVSLIFNEAIDNGVFKVGDVFDTDYQEIPGFTPPKYHTRYDSYLDKAILSLQDEFLKDESVVFAVTVDKNGYLPTHNSKYQQPISGEYAADLVGNRTKRIFDDPVGIAAARNTGAAFQQEYSRDTGEIMWDISSPIYVKGKHWGGFRIGFSLNKIQAAKKELTINLLITMGGILLGTLIVMFVIVRIFLKPLDYLTKAAAELAKGKVTKTIKIAGKSELAELANVMDKLRISIQLAISKMSARKNN